MVDEWRVGRGSKLWSRLGRRSKCKMATWSKVEHIVSTWSRVEGRGEVEDRLRGRGSNVRIGFHTDVEFRNIYAKCLYMSVLSSY